MTGKKRVLLVGGGGVGTMVAYALETGCKAEVTMVLRSNFDAVVKNGFSIDSVDHGKGIRGWKPTAIRNSMPNICQEPTLEPFDFIVVATKNIPDVGPDVVDLIAPAVTPAQFSSDTRCSTIILMQNGLNIEKPLLGRFPETPILSGVQLIGATERNGMVNHDEPDKSLIGPFEPDNHIDADMVHRSTAAAKEWVRIYNACGKVDCKFDEDVKYTRWRKLLYNSSYNSVSAILHMDVTRMRLLEHPIDELVKPIMFEIIAIAAALGVRLDEDVAHRFIVVDSLSSWFMPSMGQDAVKGNYLEFENIVGEPMREAQKHGVPCPTLTTVYGMLKAIQSKTKEAKGLMKLDVDMATRYR